MGLSTRPSRLERHHAPGWAGYPPAAFSDEHLAAAVGILAEAIGAEAMLAHVAEWTGEPVPPELEAFVRERAGSMHAVVE